MSGDSELRIELNPPGLDAATAARFLTLCFGTAWTQTEYRWYLQRSFGGEAPDQLIVMDGERMVAACGLVYRMLGTPDGALHRVSIAVAGATLPSERRRGCYAHILDAATQRSAERGCTALLGFVTADNTTGRGLRQRGATAIPTMYLTSYGLPHVAATQTLQLREETLANAWPVRAVACHRRARAEAGFYYPDVSSWRSQMLSRPHPVQALRVGASCRALIESVGDTDRLQWLDGDPRERAAAIRALAARSARRKQRFFGFSTRPGDAAVAHRLGLAVRPGYLMALASESRHQTTVRDWAALPWHVQSGDRL